MRYTRRFNFIILLVSIPVLVAGCGSINAEKNRDNAHFVSDARLQAPEQLQDVSLSIVKTGEFKTLEALFYSGGSWTSSRMGTHSAVLVRHPQGSFLFDTGLGKNVDEQFKESMPFWLKPFVAYQKIGSAQSILGEETKQRPVNRIILSHMHWDHASGLTDFPDVEVWTTREEYEAAMSDNAPEGPFIKSQYSGNNIKWKFIEFENFPYENFDQSLDVYRDGSIVLVPLPGHTAGCIGMFVNLKSGKRLFFIGDTTWALEGVQRPAHKFWFSSLLADDDKKKIEQTILKVHRLMQVYPAMAIVPAHDGKAQGKVGFFPNFVQ